MRKILSVIMVIAMLLSSILPAVATSAADADALVLNLSSAGFVENADGTASAKVDLEFTNNPGFVDISLFVYYNTTEVSEGTDEAAADYADYAAIGAGKRSTLAAVKKFFTAAGVATGANIYGKQIDINCYDPETGDPVLNTATGAALTLEFLADEFSADMIANIGIFVVDEVAYDADGNEVATEVANATIEVGAKPEDPYAPKYQAESFDKPTINLGGVTVYASGLADDEAPLAEVPVEILGNNETDLPAGIWGMTNCITYPADLTLVEFRNGDLFAANAVSSNSFLIADKKNDPIYNTMKLGFDYIGYADYDDDKATMFLVSPDDPADQMFDNGLLATCVFQLPADYEVGDRWELQISGDPDGGWQAADADNCWNVTLACDGGYIEVADFEVESFDEFTLSVQDVTTSVNSDSVSVEVFVNGNENNVAGFWATNLIIYYSPELKLQSVTPGKITYAPGDLSVGFFDLDIKDIVGDSTNYLADYVPGAFADKGFDWENNDSRFVCVYAQTTVEPGWTKNGQFMTLTFDLPAGAKADDEFFVCLATDSNNAGLIGYASENWDDVENPVFAEPLAHALNDGSIKLVGEAIAEPEPPAHEHDLEYTPGVEAGCHYTGMQEFWYCAGCDTVFADEAATIVTNRKNVIIPAKGSDLLVHMDEVAPACHYNGNIEYWVCYECEQVWADEALTQLTNIKNVIIPALGSENLQHFDAVAPQPGVNGNIEYWFCPDCETVWVDAALTQISNLKNVVIPALEIATVTVDTATIIAGDTATVALKIANNPGLFISKYIITYDASALVLDEVVNGEVFADADLIVNATEGQIILYFENMAANEDVTANGVLANLTFTAIDDCASADYVIAVVAEEGNNINAASEDVAIDVVNGAIVVIDCPHDSVTANVATQATVYDEGLIEYVCDACGEVVSTETIAKLAGIEVLEWQNAKAGEQQAYAVNILNNPGVWSLSIKFAYDSYCLAFAGVESGLFTADQYSYSVKDGVVTIYVEADALDNITEDGTAFYVVFDAIACGYSDLDVELVADNTINAAGENVAFECVDGSVIIACALTHYDAVEATCCKSGLQEYWHCEFCDAVYADAQGRYLTNRRNLYIPATAEIEYVEAVEPTCCQPGSAAYYYCPECDSVYDEDMILTNRKNLKIPATADIIYVEAVAPSCCQNGSAAYYYCSECDAVFDEDYILTNRKNLTIPATADIIYVEAVEPTCCQTGSAAYYYCSECDSVFDTDMRLTNRKNLTIPATAEIKYVEAVEATCHQKGSAAYYYCTECDAVFDEDFVLTNRKNLTIPYTAEIIHVDAMEASCCQAGNIEYWYCSECDAVFTDAALTMLSNRKNVMTSATAEIKYVPAVEPTCCQKGSAAYYYCVECDAVFDEDFVLTNRKNLTIPATAEIKYVEAVEPTCCQTGSAAYYYCVECDSVFDTDMRLTNRKNLKIPATADIIFVEAVEATCCQNGSEAYYYCSECDSVFDTDMRLTNRKNLTIPATSLEYVEAQEPSCCQNGHAAYYYCTECDAVFDEDMRLTNRKNLTIPATAEIKYVEAVPATCTANGSEAYYYCSECDAVFDTEMRLTNRKNLTIPAAGHIAGDKVVTKQPTETEEGVWEIRCTVCGELLESGTIAATAFITKASASDYAKSATLDGTTINVVAREGASYVKIAIGYNAGIKVAGDNITGANKTFAYVVINEGTNTVTFTATNANGDAVEYTVNVQWTETVFYTSFVGGYTVEKVEHSGDTFNIDVLANRNNASIGFVFAKGVTYVASEGLEVVLANGKVYFKALEAAANDTYTVTLTAANGATKTITLNFMFDYANIAGVQGGSMVDGIELEAGNVINISVSDTYKYASFRYVLKNTTSTIECDDENVERVVVSNINWFKIYNDGSNFVTTTMTVTNTKTGAVETYTVNVTFGTNN